MSKLAEEMHALSRLLGLLPAYWVLTARLAEGPGSPRESLTQKHLTKMFPGSPARSTPPTCCL